MGCGRDLPNAYVLPKRKKQFAPGRPIVSFFTSPFRPMLNCIATLTYQLLPKAFPHNLARGDVFELIKHLHNLDLDQHEPPQIYTTKTLQAFSRVSTPNVSSTVGILHSTTFPQQ